ncbi:hypothetical protein GCM10008012_47330 [Rhizobium anhuiense]|nr:hypothetical protein GCM10008012_47330 [Rhizobium anhuiense]
MAATYHVRKVAKGRWAVTSVIPGWVTPIGTFSKRSAAISTARLLAGWRSAVVVH